MKLKVCVLALATLSALGLRAEFPDRFVEYIESNGSQYIDLGDVLRSNTVAIVDFVLMAKDSVERPMFGADYCFAYLSTTKRYVRGKLGYSGPDQNVRLLHRYNVSSQKIHQSTDAGMSWSQVSAGNPSERGEGAGANAYLFGASGSSKSRASMRVYGCSITNGTTLVCDLYPCVKNGVPGLFDAVTRTILCDGAASATAFAVGSDVDIPPACFTCGYEIKGVPSRWGTSVPAYGIDACETGTTVSFALNGLDGKGWVLSADGKRRARFAGATYRPYGGAAEEIDANSFSRTLSGVAQILWRFEDEQYSCSLCASAVGSATYYVDGTEVASGTTIWVLAGSSVTVKAVPAFGYSFQKWTDGTQDLGIKPEITVTPDGSGISLTPVLRPCICVNKDSASATEDGSPENPYKTIQAGINAAQSDGDEILVAANAYPATYAIASELVNHATYKTTVRGATGNPRDIVIDAEKTGRCVKFTNGSAAESLTLTNGLLTVHSSDDECFGAGAYLSSASSLRSCVVTDCHVLSDAAATATKAWDLGGGGIYVQGEWNKTASFIEGTLVEGCSVEETSTTWKQALGLYGGGVCVYGGTVVTNSVVRGCFIRHSGGQYDGNSYGGGIGAYLQFSLPSTIVIDSAVVGNSVTNTNGKSNRMYGGGYFCLDRNGNPPTLIRTAFTNNFCTYQGGGAFSKTQLLKAHDCSFVANRSYGSGAAIYAPSVLVTNSLFAANAGQTALTVGSSKKNSGLGSCTFADNVLSGTAVSLVAANVTVCNTIFSNTCTQELSDDLLPGGAEASRVDHCFIGANPKFKSRAKGDYRLKYGSPCRGQGLVQPWMSTATDLAGAPRLDTEDGSVDIGAYQHTPFVGFSVLVK